MMVFLLVFLLPQKGVPSKNDTPAFQRHPNRGSQNRPVRSLSLLFLLRVGSEPPVRFTGFVVAHG